jgi:hypothetical protein
VYLTQESMRVRQEQERALKVGCPARENSGHARALAGYASDRPRAAAVWPPIPDANMHRVDIVYVH